MSFNDGTFTDKLNKLINTQQSIQTLSQWVLYYKKNCKEIVSVWRREIASGRRTKKLLFLYLANDVVQNSKKKTDDFVIEFGKVMQEVFREAIALEPLGTATPFRSDILHLVDIWDERKVFSPSFCSGLRKMLVAASSGGTGGLSASTTATSGTTSSTNRHNTNHASSSASSTTMGSSSSIPSSSSLSINTADMPPEVISWVKYYKVFKEACETSKNYPRCALNAVPHYDELDALSMDQLRQAAHTFSRALDPARQEETVIRAALNDKLLLFDWVNEHIFVPVKAEVTVDQQRLEALADHIKSVERLQTYLRTRLGQTSFPSNPTSTDPVNHAATTTTTTTNTSSNVKPTPSTSASLVSSQSRKTIPASRNASSTIPGVTPLPSQQYPLATSSTSSRLTTTTSSTASTFESNLPPPSAEVVEDEQPLLPFGIEPGDEPLDESMFPSESSAEAILHKFSRAQKRSVSKQQAEDISKSTDSSVHQSKRSKPSSNGPPPSSFSSILVPPKGPLPGLGGIPITVTPPSPPSVTTMPHVPSAGTFRPTQTQTSTQAPAPAVAAIPPPPPPDVAPPPPSISDFTGADRGALMNLQDILTGLYQTLQSGEGDDVVPVLENLLGGGGVGNVAPNLPNGAG